jgi:hypothetical protein
MRSAGQYFLKNGRYNARREADRYHTLVSTEKTMAGAKTNEGGQSAEPRSAIPRWALFALLGTAAFVAMGLPMLSMMYFMSQMNSHMGRMVDSVETMTGYLHSMNVGVVSMDGNIDDIEASIVAMDDNIYTINSAIQHIQSAMADDMDSMRGDVAQLNGAVQHMAGNMSGMHAQMNQMRRDIGYGTATFTQPWNLMQNMAP